MNKILCYSKDEEGRYLSVNETFLVTVQAENPQSVLGKTDIDLPWRDFSEHIMNNDKAVMQTGTNQIFFEQKISQGENQLFRSLKIPMIDSVTNQSSIHCLSIPVSDSCLIPLTNQQTLCLKYMGLGLTHKEIGETLRLSQKTVEHYLEAVKLKLSCKTRSEMIKQAIERGLIGQF